MGCDGIDQRGEERKEDKPLFSLAPFAPLWFRLPDVD